MKRIFVLLLAASIYTATMQSCGSKKEEAKDETKTEDAYSDHETSEPAAPDTKDLVAQGQTLVDASDCKTCHHATNKLIGPAHADVAKKYEFNRANTSMLADKIMNGGSGNWGEIPMSPHPDLSKSDAEKMAMYVLSLDGEDFKE